MHGISRCKTVGTHLLKKLANLFFESYVRQ